MTIDETTWNKILRTFSQNEAETVQFTFYGVGRTATGETLHYAASDELPQPLVAKIEALQSEQPEHSE